MTALVIKAFIDRETSDLHRPGENYAGTEARIKELAEGGFVKASEKPVEQPKKTRKKKTE